MTEARATPIVPPSGFDRFVAIDWSGAKGHRHRGIAIAHCDGGSAAPQIVPQPDRRGWSRAEVGEWVLGLPGRALVGFDFSFSAPFEDCGAFMPGTGAPDLGPAFWAWLDDHCRDPVLDADLGALSFVAAHSGPGRHFWTGLADGPKQDFQRWRACEAQFNAMGGGKASSVFDCLGASQVGKASFSGMRLLHRLSSHLPVWPFQDPQPNRHLLVEIYTRAMIRHAGLPGRKIRTLADLNVALGNLGSAPLVPNGLLSDHDTDVLVSAAALRRLVADPALWDPIDMNTAVARTEGWTFGIG